MKKYSLEEIKNYILSQDSLGDALYNLNEANIDLYNQVPEPTENQEISEVLSCDGCAFVICKDENDIYSVSIIKEINYSLYVSDLGKNYDNRHHIETWYKSLFKVLWAFGTEELLIKFWDKHIKQ